MAKQELRSVVNGNVKWNEDDRLTMAALLVKAGYAVQLVRKEVEGAKAKKYEYVIEFGERVE